MKVRFQADCVADLRETWEVELPDVDGEVYMPDVIEAVTDKLFAGDATFIEQTADNERDREVDLSTIEIQ